MVSVSPRSKGGMPKCMIMLNMKMEKEAFLQGAGYEVIDFGNNIFAINAAYGFMEDPNIRELLREVKEKGLIPFDVSRCTLEAAEPELILDEDVPLLRSLRARVFRFFSRVSASTYRFFGLTADANLSQTLIPIHITKDDAHVIRLNDEHLKV